MCIVKSSLHSDDAPKEMPEVIHKSLVEQVTDAIVDLIESDGLKPGDKLPSTAALTQTYGVSRPVVREALKTLEGRGMIEISGGRSAVIRPVSGEVLRSYFKRAMTVEHDNSLDILEVRYGIEMQCARLAAERRSQEELAGLTTLVERMRDQLDQPETYADLDVTLHLLIAESTQNTLLYQLVHSIRDALRDMIREGLAQRLTPEELERVQSAHEHIVAAIAAADPDAAAQAMAFHFDDAIRAIFE